ncbi:hypothetical protein [Burkholderia sp. MSMB1072]|nr:hypothetical protein [Burkholderia sp. MSMB1072]
MQFLHQQHRLDDLNTLQANQELLRKVAKFGIAGSLLAMFAAVAIVLFAR